MQKPRQKTPMPDLSDVSSMTDCTGLMPTPPLDEGELESYQDLFRMALPTERREKETPHEHQH